MEDKHWSTYQQAIFAEVASGEGHTVVKAGPGSGKTTTAVEALKYIPAGKSALFVAFNKSIAEELAARAPKGVAVSTLHSYGNRAVVNAYGRLRLDSRKVEDLARGLVGDDRKDWGKRRALARAVSLAKGTLADSVDGIDALIDAYGLDIEEIDRKVFIGHVLSLLDSCKEASGSGTIDFDDMVWLPVVNKLRVFQYDRVFVDETQDLNACQLQLVKGAIKKGGRILAIGDERQAIYGFRGADQEAMPRMVRELGARVLPLSVSYRCARSIVEVAREIEPCLECAPGAPDGIVQAVSVERMMKEVQPGDFILSRTNAPLVSLCFALLREGRRAHIQGRDIGATLISFVKNAQIGSVEGLRQHITRWRDAEMKRLHEKKNPSESAMDAVEDKANMLLVLTDGAASPSDVVSKIEQIFADSDDKNRIVLSSTHKAKGLERDRVWILEDTYRNRPGVEEENLWYVGCTRAKLALFMVRGNSSRHERFTDDP